MYIHPPSGNAPKGLHVPRNYFGNHRWTRKLQRLLPGVVRIGQAERERERERERARESSDPAQTVVAKEGGCRAEDRPLGRSRTEPVTFLGTKPATMDAPPQRLRRCRTFTVQRGLANCTWVPRSEDATPSHDPAGGLSLRRRVGS